MANVCRVIGVLDNGVAGLSASALQALQEAQLVIGSRRVLEQFQAILSHDVECRDLTGRLQAVVQWIVTAQDEGRRVVVLASGDPLCYGIGSYLIERLGRAAIEILPNISSLQLACSCLGQPWQDMKIVSVHARNSGEWIMGAGPEHALYPVLQAVGRDSLVGILTSPANTPDRLARLLMSEGLAQDVEMAVAECLRQPEQRIHDWAPVADFSQRHFADPNVVLVRRYKTAGQIRFGFPDTYYHQRKPDKGLITKREVRAVSLALLQLTERSVVWDIGAGSGSVGLEAARLCPDGHVYAIEKNEEDVRIAGTNRLAMRVTNYTLVQGKAPLGLDAWPVPNAVFIGGSGGELRELMRYCLDRLADFGMLVMNFVTLENLALACEVLRACGLSWEVTQLQAARSRPILDMHRLQAENPVWIVAVIKTPRVEE